jgi:hypothetical protein
MTSLADFTQARAFDLIVMASIRASLDGFVGQNARRFLGFDDADNANCKRLRKRYEDFGLSSPAWLAS